MKRQILLATVIAALSVWGVSFGEASPPGTPLCPVSGTRCCSGGLLSGCPNDYCRKPWPRIWCLTCGQPDDYCPKPGPRVWMLGHCNLPDDYCRKPCPHLCRPLCPDHYTCGYPGPGRPVLPGLAPAIEMKQQGVPSGQNHGRAGMESPYPQ